MARAVAWYAEHDRIVTAPTRDEARKSSHVYVVADDLDQAVEDLTREWSVERRVRWAIDTGTPSPGLAPDRPPPASALRLARLRAERAAVAAAIPPDPRPLLDHLDQTRRHLTHPLEERQEWLSSHPEATRRLKRLDADLAHAERTVAPSIVDDLMDRLGHQSAALRKTHERDLGLDAGIDFGP